MRRAIIYLFFDRDGVVGDFIVHQLRALSEVAEHILFVSNGPIQEGRERVEPLVQDVFERENEGFDVGGYRDALARLTNVGEFDELILMNYTFYGPIGSYDALFERFDADDVDFWGITDHAEISPNPYTYKGTLPRHIQSHWIAVRKRVLQSEAWREYWRDMPEITSYADSVQLHEARFTPYFESRGFTSKTAFPASEYNDAHPVMNVCDVMLDDGLPIVKRRLFFHDPLYHDEHALRGRATVEKMAKAGYPLELLYQDVAREVRPRALNMVLSMMEIMPDVDLGGAAIDSLKIGVLAHVFYVDSLDEILHYADHLPVDYTLVATTDTEQKRDAILACLQDRGRVGDRVHVVGSNRGRDVSAFLVGCKEELLGDEFDLVVKLHSKKSPQDGFNRGREFKDHLFENLLGSPGYSANLLRLFVDHPTLGIVVPPMIHTGFPTMGRAWFANREPALKLMKQLGINVTMDTHSPLAAYGSMFIARPSGLRKLVEAGFSWDDFPEEGGYADGSLAHVLERLFVYAVVSEGMHARTVMTTRAAARSHTSLEYKLNEMDAGMPGNQRQQIEFAHRSRFLGPIGNAKYLLATRAPKLARMLLPAYGAVRTVRNRSIRWVRQR